MIQYEVTFVFDNPAKAMMHLHMVLNRTFLDDVIDVRLEHKES